MKLRWGFAITCVVGLATVAWQPWRATEGPGGPTAATVNGAALSLRAVAALAADRASFEQFRDALVEQAVADLLVHQEAARRGIALTEAEDRELDRRMPPVAVLIAQAGTLELSLVEVIAQRRALLRGQRLLRKLLDVEFPGELAPDDAALRRAFDQAPLAYAEPPSATVRAFVVPLAETADATQVNAAAARAGFLADAARAVDSAEAFSALVARQQALPAGSADGKLGTLALADPFAPLPAIPPLLGPALSGELIHALFPLPGEPGDRVVGPFRGPAGLYGLYVEDRRGPGDAPRFDDVRDRVRERWVGRAQASLIPRLIGRLRAAATIDLHPHAGASA